MYYFFARPPSLARRPALVGCTQQSVHSSTFSLVLLIIAVPPEATREYQIVFGGKTPESGIPPSYRATRLVGKSQARNFTAIRPFIILFYCLLDVRRPGIRIEQTRIARVFNAATNKRLTGEFTEFKKTRATAG